MTARGISLAATILFLGGWTTSVHASELPPDQPVAYLIHEVNTDCTSPVALSVTLLLHAQAAEGTAIGWAITTIEIRVPGENGGPSKVWSQAQPALGTADGLWWVEHANSAPHAADFVAPPLVAGVASTPNGDVLHYDFAHSVSATPPSAAPYSTTAVLDYRFTVGPDSTLVAAGTDEPVDVPDNPDPPGSVG